MTIEHVITPDSKCPCGKQVDASGSGYCSYECYSEHDLGAPIEPSSPAPMGEPQGEAERLAEAPQHEFTIRAAYNRTALMCACGWSATCSSGLDARQQLEAAHADHVAASVPQTATERLAEIRTALTDLDEVSNGMTGVRGRYAWGFSGVSQHINMHTDLRWLLSRVGVLEGQLATAEDRVLIEQGEVIKRDKAIKSLERALDEQRWYGEQLQMSLDSCSGNHLEVEEYPGDSAALGLGEGDSR